VNCCGMGSQGCALCMISVPIKILEPLGGCVWFAINSGNMRRQIVEKYNINDDNPCCCCMSIPSCCVGKNISDSS
jgi:hypothetical protein